MITDKKTLKEIEETKKFLIRIFLISLSIFLLIIFFNAAPQFLLNNAAKYFVKNNNFSNAENCYKVILKYEYTIYRNIKHTNPKWLNKLAQVYTKDKKYDLAILCYREANSIYESYKHFTSKKHFWIYADRIIQNLIEIGNIYLIKNESNKALMEYKDALSYSKTYPNKISLKKINSIIKNINKLTMENRNKE